MISAAEAWPVERIIKVAREKPEKRRHMFRLADAIYWSLTAQDRHREARRYWDAARVIGDTL